MSRITLPENITASQALSTKVAIVQLANNMSNTSKDFKSMVNYLHNYVFEDIENCYVEILPEEDQPIIKQECLID
jgi:hypothetical protein